MIARRKSTGATVFLVSLIIGAIVFVVVCGIGFNYLLLIRARAQFEADAMAVSLASKINATDRIGEFNEMQQASRQLVFVARQDSNKCADLNLPGFSGLCAQLTDSARSGHTLVENERQNQIAVIKKEAQAAVVTYNSTRGKTSILSLFGLQVFEPEILSVDLGRIAKVNSNVRGPQAIPELAMFDKQEKYLDKTDKFYLSDINAKLPEPDKDLDFKLSSLPPYIGKTDAPTRNTNAQVFVPYGTIYADGKIKNPTITQIPSAIQIHYNMDVIIPWNQSTVTSIALISTGSASGASADSR
jgi:hypothetical protein